MKKLIPFILIVIIMLTAFISCQKSSSTANNITVKGIAGTYALKALVWNDNGTLINVYDSLDACEQDNIVRFNTNKTFDLIDTGVVCSPDESGSGTWDLKGDSLLFNSGYSNSKIQSFDGTTLVLTGKPEATTGVTATTTFVKQ